MCRRRWFRSAEEVPGTRQFAFDEGGSHGLYGKDVLEIIVEVDWAALFKGGRMVAADHETLSSDGRHVWLEQVYRLPGIVISSSALGGCAIQGAPSFELFGAFFPAWMLCASIGIIGGIAARVIFIAVGLDSRVQFRVFVCSSVGVVVAAGTWLFWFGQ
jgi:hypothetical protein